MFLRNLLRCVLFIASAAHSAPTQSPGCASNKDACVCQAGTTFFECTTRAVIGAAVMDVRALTGDFFHTEWMGLSPLGTEGEDNVVGATRNLSVPTQVGTYNFTEELLVMDHTGDGSYTLKFKQQNVPVSFDPEFGPGTFSGFWVTRSASYAGPFQTQMDWNVYACLTGMVGFPEFHRYALNKATATLQMQGKIKGTSEAPHSDCQSSDNGIYPSAEQISAQENSRGSRELRIQIDL